MAALKKKKNPVLIRGPIPTPQGVGGGPDPGSARPFPRCRLAGRMRGAARKQAPGRAAG